MNEMDFLEGINELDPELLEEKSKAKRSVRPKAVRWIAIAAALLLILGGTTVYAITNNIKLGKFTRPGGEQVVSAEATLPLVKWKSFKGDVKNAGEIIAEQYVTYTPAPAHSSTMVLPGVYGRSFDSIEEAMEYIGLKGLKTPPFPYDDFDRCSVTAQGNAEGQVESVELYIEHVNGYEMGAQEYVTILTEYAEDGSLDKSVASSPDFPRDVEFLYYTTPGGNECRIAVSRPQFESRYMSLSGYVISGSAFYWLNLGGVPQTDYDHALEVMHAWADGLD